MKTQSELLSSLISVPTPLKYIKSLTQLFDQAISTNSISFHKILQNNRYRQQISLEISSRYIDQTVDVVVSPITLGALLGSRVASLLKVDILYIDVDDFGKPIGFVDCNYDFSYNHVLVVDDVAFTGEGLKTIINLKEFDSKAISICVFAMSDQILMNNLQAIVYLKEAVKPTQQPLKWSFLVFGGVL